MRADNSPSRLAAAVRPPRPWLRIKASPQVARILEAAGASVTWPADPGRDRAHSLSQSVTKHAAPHHLITAGIADLIRTGFVSANRRSAHREATAVSATAASTNLAGADLAGRDLTGANLVRANLAGANLAGANLAGANLAGANLAGANLARANLVGTDLSGADLAEAHLGSSSEHHLETMGLSEEEILFLLDEIPSTGLKLAGAVWTDQTRWPAWVKPSLARRSKEVRPGVWQVADVGGADVNSRAQQPT